MIITIRIVNSRKILNNVQLKSRYTIVIVTHNMQQASRASDYTVFMLDGEIIEVSPTKDLFTSPKDIRTERYVTGKLG